VGERRPLKVTSLDLLNGLNLGFETEKPIANSGFIKLFVHGEMAAECVPE